MRIVHRAAAKRHRKPKERFRPLRLEALGQAGDLEGADEPLTALREALGRLDGELRHLGREMGAG